MLMNYLYIPPNRNKTSGSEDPISFYRFDWKINKTMELVYWKQTSSRCRICWKRAWRNFI